MSDFFDEFTFGNSQDNDFQVISPAMSPVETNYFLNPAPFIPLPERPVVQFYDPQEAKRYAKLNHWEGEITCNSKLLSFVRIDKRRYFPPIKIVFTPK